MERLRAELSVAMQKMWGIAQKRGVSQRSMADAAKVSRQTMCHWCSGIALPGNVHAVKRVADFLGLHWNLTIALDVDEKPDKKSRARKK